MKVGKFYLAEGLIEKILIGAALIYAIWIVIIFPKWTVDDAFITFRYAENLANHGVLSWNISGAHVEGYTGIALPVILAGFIKLGISPVLTSHLIGLVFFFLSGILLWLIFRKLNVSILVSGIVIFLFATNQVLFTHAFSGLETVMFLGIILASIYAFLIRISTKKYSFKYDLYLSLSLFLASLIRPEGLALSIVFFCTAFFFIYKHNKEKTRKFVTGFLLFYLIPSLFYFYWRWNYYGYLLPNTYYIKSTSGFSFSNFGDTSRFFRTFFAVPLVGAFMIISSEMDWLWDKIKLFFDKKIIYLVVANFIFVFLLLLEVFHSHLTMNYAGRFYIPFLPAIWILIALLLEFGYRALLEAKIKRPLGYIFTLCFLGILILYQTLFQISKIKEEYNFAENYKLLLETEHISIGKLLKDIIPSSEKLTVYMDAGAIPYFSQLQSVDFGGLNDLILAHDKLTPVERIDYFFSSRPGAVVFTSSSPDRLDNPETQTMVDDPRFKNYTLFKVYSYPNSDVAYSELVYLRKDIYGKIK